MGETENVLNICIIKGENEMYAGDDVAGPDVEGIAIPSPLPKESSPRPVKELIDSKVKIEIDAFKKSKVCETDTDGKTTEQSKGDKKRKSIKYNASNFVGGRDLLAHLCSQEQDLSSALLSADQHLAVKADLSQVEDGRGRTLLHLAAEGMDLPLVRLLVGTCMQRNLTNIYNLLSGSKKLFFHFSTYRSILLVLKNEQAFFLLNTEQ